MQKVDFANSEFLVVIFHSYGMFYEGARLHLEDIVDVSFLTFSGPHAPSVRHGPSCKWGPQDFLHVSKLEEIIHSLKKKKKRCLLSSCALTTGTNFEVETRQVTTWGFGGRKVTGIYFLKEFTRDALCNGMTNMMNTFKFILLFQSWVRSGQSMMVLTQ